jgi:hypothetical protein
MVWTEGYQFAEPLVDLRGVPDRAKALQGELLRELVPGHPLYGRDLRVIARALPQDEVVVETEGAVAIVHLTWSNGPERLPCPRFLWIRSAEHFEEVIEFRY